MGWLQYRARVRADAAQGGNVNPCGASGRGRKGPLSGHAGSMPIVLCSLVTIGTHDHFIANDLEQNHTAPRAERDHQFA